MIQMRTMTHLGRHRAQRRLVWMTITSGYACVLFGMLWMHVIVFGLWMINLELMVTHIHTKRQHGVIALKLVSPKLIYNSKGYFKLKLEFLEILIVEGSHTLSQLLL